MFFAERLRVLRAEVQLIALYGRTRHRSQRQGRRVVRECHGSRMRYIPPKIRNVRANGKIFKYFKSGPQI